MQKPILSLLILTLLAVSSANAQKHFKILDATSQSWSGGLPQNGTGTTYTLEILLKTDLKVEFKDIWMGQDNGLLETSSLYYSDGRTMKKGDTVLVKYTIHRYPPNSPMADMAKPPLKPAPIYYKGAALISYTIGASAPLYRSVASFRKLPTENHP
jgi:hypothetical protein